MTETGIVIRLDGKYAVVSVIRKSACVGERGGCSGSCAGCSGCSSKALEARVINEAGARPGDTVELYAPDSRMLLLSAAIFFFPLLAAIAAYFAAKLFGADDEAALFVAAAMFALTGIASLFFTNRTKESFAVKAVRIISTPSHEKTE
ncbi:MAG: SoxR reducing system RseC family protein [Oscillospiraceae bacterium]|nr:SoxR reducing system RseC family protein [Oscillospiraceae bacterium]